MGVFVAVGASAVSVATAAVCTATWVATRSGIGVASAAQAVRIRARVRQQSFPKRGFITFTPLSSNVGSLGTSHRAPILPSGSRVRPSQSECRAGVSSRFHIGQVILDLMLLSVTLLPSRTPISYVI